MIIVRPDVEFTSVVEGLEPNLVGTLDWGLIRPPDLTVVSPTTAGITEIESGDDPTGAYTRTTTSPAEEGMYLIIWDDQTHPVYTEELIVSYSLFELPTLDVPFMPTLADVAAVDLVRTKDDVGEELGIFTENTRPKHDRVVLLIRSATEDFISKVGTDIPVHFQQRARELIAIKVAMMIELSYFGAEVATERSPYKMYRDMLKEEFGPFVSSIEAYELGEDPANAPNKRLAAYTFPAPDDLLTRKM